MNRAPARYLVPLLPLILLAGCASTRSEFPSLAIRDSERVSGTLAAPAPTPTPVPPPAGQVQLADLLARVREAHRAFTNAAPAVRRTVAAARGSGTGSENWSVAQVAVANLEAQRSQVMIALADIDRIHVEAATSGADTMATQAALGEANRLVDEENAEVARLLGTLGN